MNIPDITDNNGECDYWVVKLEVSHFYEVLKSRTIVQPKTQRFRNVKNNTQDILNSLLKGKQH